MSRIIFHSPSGYAEVRGTERAYMNNFCNDQLVAGLGLNHPFVSLDWLRPMLDQKQASYFINDYSAQFASKLAIFLSVNGERSLTIGGELVSPLSLALNTVMALGNEPAALLARLNGQCEIHCYVLGPNRRWMANIIRRGRASSLYRKNQGWESLIEFLESKDDEPVVCSYSVCRQFPNFTIVPVDEGLQPEEVDEAYMNFDKLDSAEQWAVCMPHLHPLMELKPEGFLDYYFDSGLSAFKLKEEYQK